MADEAPVQADARRVVDWYRLHLAAAQHDLAFATCALAAEQEQTALLREELGKMRAELDEMLASLATAADRAPSPDDEAFEAWVAEHWEQIEDARISHAVRNAEA